MNRHYNLSLHLDLEKETEGQCFSLRILPMEDAHQKTVDSNWTIQQCDYPARTQDGFGNHLIYGRIDEPLKYLHADMQVTLEVNTDVAPIAELDHRPGMYTVTTESTHWSKPFLGLFEEDNLFSIEDDLAFAMECATRVHELLEPIPGYRPQNIHFDHVLEKKEGNCQDFSHLMLSLLRFRELPCRFVSGISMETNLLRCWVEVLIENEWVGLDAVENRRTPHDVYIKLAHGRDFEDCRIYRGPLIKDLPESAIRIQIQAQEAKSGQ